ncbi:hypothetical protein HW132_02950 [Brasilonema sp. CT11]|nr:hypothetical protein [Brasilonema sp. CT11]
MLAFSQPIQESNQYTNGQIVKAPYRNMVMKIFNLTAALLVLKAVMHSQNASVNQSDAGTLLLITIGLSLPKEYQKNICSILL